LSLRGISRSRRIHIRAKIRLIGRLSFVKDLEALTPHDSEIDEMVLISKANVGPGQDGFE
jgi:hypothetical protein